jgi:hypothetical protein
MVAGLRHLDVPARGHDACDATARQRREVIEWSGKA